MKKTIRIIVLLMIGLILFPRASFGQTVEYRPALWGIAKMTFLVSDFGMAREYYGKFLGFDEALTYESDKGRIISFKVNDRQFLEFIEDSRAVEKSRLVSVSLETNHADQLRRYMQSNGWPVPVQTRMDGAGNEVFLVEDPSGNSIEFIDFKEDGMHSQSKGKYLSDRRISKRIHHAGLYVKNIGDDDPFYAGILNFPEILRYPEDKSVPPTMIYFGMGDCPESIEHYSPNDPNFTHPCLLVDDMMEALYTLKDRQGSFQLGRPMIGKGKRWILNISNPDGTKVEFTEPYTVK